jgi:fructose-bisphosphate aldolase, class I
MWACPPKENAVSIGKKIRLNRLFAHPSGRLCSIAVDHFIGYGHGLPPALETMPSTLNAIVSAQPDAVTMMKGIAKTAWEPYAGKVPLIIQSMLARPDDLAYEQVATPEEVVRLGADALATVAYVHGANEPFYLRVVADVVREAEKHELPVIVHIYPRAKSSDYKTVSFAPEDVAWAVHCALELGVDIIKVPYCGDIKAYAQIVAETPVPVVAAGGPQQDTLEAALQMMADVIASGARGATIGRNVWSQADIGATVQAFKAVIHDCASPQEALCIAGL